MIDKIKLNVPLSIPECLLWIGTIAKSLPYNKGEGLLAEALCKEMAGKLKTQKVIVPINAVDILVKVVDQARKEGNDILIKDIEELIKLLKGGLDRKIIGILLKKFSMKDFVETDEGDLKTELIVPKHLR